MAEYLRNNRWWVAYPNPATGKPKRIPTGIINTGKESRKLAAAIYAKKLTEIAEGKFLDIKREEQIKFKDYALFYLETYSKVNLKNWQNDAAILSPENPKGLVAHFGELYLHEIKPLDIEKYKQVRLRDDGVKASTVNVGLKLLSAMFNKAITWEKILANPCRKVDRLTEKNNRLRYFSIEELNKIITSTVEPMKSIIIAAVSTGMRRSELLNLQWPDVDLGKNQICLVDQKNKQISYISIHHIRDIFVRINVNPASPYVFNSINGTKYNEQYISNHMLEILRNLGIKDASFHTLRHTFASHLAMNGVGLYTISKLMRHSSIKMTERYAHLSKEHSDQALNSLANRFDTLMPKHTKNTQSNIENENKEFNSIVTSMELNTSNTD